MVYKLRWSDESVKNLEDILEDIKFKWTDKEVDIFKIKLSHQLDLILHRPYMFPASTIKAFSFSTHISFWQNGCGFFSVNPTEIENR